MLKLEDTRDMMISQDYKERFKAEYIQLYIRTVKLGRMLNNWAHLDFKPTCPKYVLQNQYKAMSQYLTVLTERAERENIKLPEIAEFYI